MKVGEKIAMTRIKIFAPIDACQAYVEIDGRRIDGVVRIEFEAKPGLRETTARLTIMGEVRIEAEFRESEIVRAERK